MFSKGVQVYETIRSVIDKAININKNPFEFVPLIAQCSIEIE
jgi:hypothetical protein